ncbi:MAG: hypothetical protein M0020_06560 [Actinomycetota bacterium]|nr:hypothetical protein [Actinomycetota bacterium]
MRRRTFDKLTTAVGAVLVVALVAVGSLALWGYSYANSNVHNQLAAQKIFFPPKAAFQDAKAGTEITPGMIPYIEKYAGQQVLTGQQAEAYADHFISVHLSGAIYMFLGAIQLTGPSQVRGFSMAGRPAGAPCLADGPA